MKFDITFTLRGPTGAAEAPNKYNPVEAPDLGTLLREISHSLPRNETLGLETVGIAIRLATEPADECDTR